MIIGCDSYKDPKKLYNYNEWCLENLKGSLPDEQLMPTLGKFLYHNLNFTVSFLTGESFILHPFQHAILNSWFQRNYCMNVMTRGGGKTTIAALFSLLYPIFNPGAKIVLASANFRTSRKIIEEMRRIVQNKNSTVLRQCIPSEPCRRSDAWTWEINGGEVVALPLTEGTRGQRCDVLICDEFLLLPEDFVEKVLFPFIAAKTDQNYLMKVVRLEDRLIAEGKMTESERTKFDSKKKMIALSSASYEFEYLYKLFTRWKEKVLRNDSEDDFTDAEAGVKKIGSYFVCQFSYKALPPECIDETALSEAQEGSESTFAREWQARFINDSEAYFSARKMRECTTPNGCDPVLELCGNPRDEYILAIDPNLSGHSPHGDNFAMCVGKLDKQNQSLVVVHNYAKVCVPLEDHIIYFKYLLDHFNIKFVIIDNAGADGFIDACNSSTIFNDGRRKIDFLSTDVTFSIDDIQGSIKKLRKEYDPYNGKYCYRQIFAHNVRSMNEHLLWSFDKQKVIFASKICTNKTALQRSLEFRPRDLMETIEGEDEREKMLKLCEYQDDLIDTVKKECAMIQCKTTGAGNFTFDLPAAISKSTSPRRMRKDNYTTLMLSAWATKWYYLLEDSYHQPEEPTGFVPFFV